MLAILIELRDHGAAYVSRRTREQFVVRGHRSGRLWRLDE